MISLEAMMVDDSQAIMSKKDKKKNKEQKNDEEEVDDDKMEEEAEESNNPVQNIKAFKKMVVKTLEDNAMNEKRACKMEIIDFLNLLNIFNEKGVHFK